MKRVRVAAAQVAPVFMDRAATLAKAVDTVQEAARGGAELVVFPEAFVPGYPFWAMALNPKILFLDEPTAGLDPIIAAEIDELVLSINRSIGTTIVIVTHELDSIFKVAGRVIMLDKIKKGIIAEGDPKELKKQSSNPFVRQFFNREAGSVKKII